MQITRELERKYGLHDAERKSRRTDMPPVSYTHLLVAVGRDTPLHRQVADVEVQRFSRKPVHHLDAEGRERAAVVGFLRCV